jgi:hypothetical protein
VYELANWVEGNISRLLDEGELALIHHAGQVRLTLSMWNDKPNVDSPAGIRVRTAIEAFDKEYEACCKRLDAKRRAVPRSL